MGMNNMELSPAVLAALYSSHLIDTGEEILPAIAPAVIPEKKTVNAPENPWKSLGNNKQNILIVVRYEDSPYLPDTELTLLTNMLSACKLSLGDVAIINLQHYRGISGKDILIHFKSKRAILFGIEPSEFGLPVSFPVFQVQNVANATFLYSPDLEKIGADKLAKSKLWVCLQRLFSI